MDTSEFIAEGNPAMDKHPIQGGVEIILVASCCRNQGKLRPDGPLGSYADGMEGYWESGPYSFYASPTLLTIKRMTMARFKIAQLLLINIC